MRPEPSVDSSFVSRTSTLRSDEEQLALFPDPEADAGDPDATARPAVGLELRRELLALFNPLAAVVGFTDLLLEDSALDEADVRRVRLIHEAGREIKRRLRRVIGGLADAPPLDDASVPLPWPSVRGTATARNRLR